MFLSLEIIRNVQLSALKYCYKVVLGVNFFLKNKKIFNI